MSEIPSSVFIPTGAVRSKLRQEQRLYDVQCALLLKDLNERRRQLERSRRRMKLELDMIETGVQDHVNGLQYTGFYPPLPDGSGSRDPTAVMYDVRVTRPRNRIPLRKVCTYKLNSLQDADTATPVVVDARRTLIRVRMRNSASARYRKSSATSKASTTSGSGSISRSMSAPEYVSNLETQKVAISAASSTSAWSGDRKSTAEVGADIKAGSGQHGPSNKSVSGELRKGRTFVRNVWSGDADINVDIRTLVSTDEALRDRTRVFPALERKLVPRKPHKPSVRHTSFVVDRKTSPRTRKTAVGGSRTPRIQAHRTRYRTPTPLPTGDISSEDLDNVVTQVCLSNGVAVGDPHNGGSKVYSQLSLNKQQALSGAERTVQLEPESNSIHMMDSRENSTMESAREEARSVVMESLSRAMQRVDGLKGAEGNPEHVENLATSELINGVENMNIGTQSDSTSDHIQGVIPRESTSKSKRFDEVDNSTSTEEELQNQGIRPVKRKTRNIQDVRAVSRKSSRVSFNEDVVVANYYQEDEDYIEDVALWTSEDDEDEEILMLYSPPSEEETDEGEASFNSNGHGGTHHRPLVYTGTQRLKSNEAENKPERYTARPASPKIIYTSGFLTFKERCKTFSKNEKLHNAKIRWNSNNAKPPVKRPNGPIGLRGGGRKTAVVKPSPPSNSRPNSGVNSKPDTIRGKARNIESRMHTALSSLDSATPERGRTFTASSASYQKQTTFTKDVVQRTPTRGQQVSVLSGIRTPVGGLRGPPSATEERQRGRRPSAQLMQMIDRRRASMSTSEQLQLEEERQKQQNK